MPAWPAASSPSRWVAGRAIAVRGTSRLPMVAGSGPGVRIGARPSRPALRSASRARRPQPVPSAALSTPSPAARYHAALGTADRTSAKRPGRVSGIHYPPLPAWAGPYRGSGMSIVAELDTTTRGDRRRLDRGRRDQPPGERGGIITSRRCIASGRLGGPLWHGHGIGWHRTC